MLQELLNPWYLAPIGALVVLRLLVMRFLNSAREKALRRLADDHGLPFSPAGDDPRALRRITGLKVFDTGRDMRLLNRLDVRGGDGATGLCFMDCAYIPKHGNREFVFSLVIADFGNVSLPEFELTPKDFSADVGALIGRRGAGIDLPEFPEFSAGYILTAADPARTAEFFMAGAAKCFEATGHIQAQSSGRYLALYSSYTLVPAKDYEGHIGAVRELADGLAAAARRS